MAEIKINVIAFQLTRLMRGVTTGTAARRSDRSISTHTPHARRDTSDFKVKQQQPYISTHTPHARRDYSIGAIWSLQRAFQLTRLMRGVTTVFLSHTHQVKFQLTRLMRGVTVVQSTIHPHGMISTHTPHARRDFRSLSPCYAGYDFNSHASCEA